MTIRFLLSEFNFFTRAESRPRANARKTSTNLRATVVDFAKSCSFIQKIAVSIGFLREHEEPCLVTKAAQNTIAKEPTKNFFLGTTGFIN